MDARTAMLSAWCALVVRALSVLVICMVWLPVPTAAQLAPPEGGPPESGPVVSALTVLLETVEHGSTEERVKAVRELGESQAEEAFKAVVRACSDSDFYVRYFALRSLRQIGNPAGLSGAKACLGDKYPMVRKEAAETVEALSGDAEAVWKEILGQVTSPPGRAVALARLADINADACREEILEAAAHEDVHMRQAAARGLARLGRATDVELLRKLAEAPETSVRLGVVDACFLLSDKRRCFDLLRPLCFDHSQGVRRKCIVGLASLDVPDVGALYLEILSKEEAPRLRVLAAKQLATAAQPQESLDGLRAILEQEREESVRQAITRTLQILSSDPTADK